MRFITSTREYLEIYNNNTKSEGDLFIFLKKKISEDILAVGIVVSKKVGKAVIRNKLKRRIKAFLRENINIHPTNEKIIIIARSVAGNAAWQEIKKDLTMLFGT
ncbi:MAG: ribonuclease P protein component [Candidatus Cloacimonetes bacterium]|nr:ribonuclease P protein component [Candidatus Cloacimonadota bacterium]